MLKLSYRAVSVLPYKENETNGRMYIFMITALTYIVRYK